MGWEKMREQIFANQKRLGVIPANTQLTPWPDDLPKWDSLTEVQRKLYAHQAEVFAAYTAYTDDEIGRVIQEVENMGKLDNTLIIYIDGDNGTSPEGTLAGTFNQLTAYNGITSVPEPLQLLHYEAWGSDKTYPHMAVAWAVTYQRKNAMDVGIPRDGALRRKGSVKADKVVFIANGTAEVADGILARTSAGRSTTTSATHFVRLHSAINFSERNRT